jgi:serine/threonine protein kinase
MRLIKEFLDLNNKSKTKLEKIGYKIGKKIASGSFGSAYNLIDDYDKILKATIDKNEAFSLNKIKNKNNKNLVKIFRVFKFVDGNVFYLLQEKLYPINELKNIEIYSSKSYDESYQKCGKFVEFLFFNKDKIKLKNIKFVLNHFDKESLINNLIFLTPYPFNNQNYETNSDYYQKIANSQFWFFLNNINDYCKILIENPKISDIIKQVVNGIKEAKKYKIENLDIHSGNIMKRKNGQVVLVDFARDFDQTSIEEI